MDTLTQFKNHEHHREISVRISLAMAETTLHGSDLTLNARCILNKLDKYTIVY